MTNEVRSLLEDLKRAVTAFVVPIQTTKVINEQAFAELHQIAMNLVRALRGSEDAPKQVLKELLATFSIMRNEAPYFGANTSTLERMADSIEVCFRLIIANEVPEDRKPVVPRNA